MDSTKAELTEIMTSEGIYILEIIYKMWPWPEPINTWNLTLY